MRICYVGNFLHSWCTEVHVARDAERIPGVTVDRVQEPDWLVSHALATTRPRWAKWLAALERRASNADVLIYQRTWGLPDEAVALWRTLEQNGTRTISYHLDLYRGLARESTIVGDPFWSTGVVFTADGDPATTAWLAERGVDHRWMPAAMVSDEVGWTPGRARPGVDVVFVGSHAAYHDEWPWRQELLEQMRRTYGSRFAVYPRNGQRVHGATLSALYSSVPVVVGDSLALPGHVGYWSDRFYETVGRGGILVGPRVPGIEAEFVNGEHLLLYELGDLASVVTTVEYALAMSDRTRNFMRVGGVQHVRDHHTYTHRVRAMLASLGFHELAVP